MANKDEPNTNGSQFFFTFAACPWIDKKNTIFGKIVGESIYNLINIQNIDTDSQDRPIDPPKIISIQIIENPFEDIVLRDNQEVVKRN